MAAISGFARRLRRTLLVFLIANIILTITRQIFDLMGYVWTPIVADFFNIIVTIFALFAAAQLRSRFFYVYFGWAPFWLAWNSFLICYYFNVGFLNRDDATPLSWGVGGRSWWSTHTPGCRRTYNATSATVEIGGCRYVEPFHVEIAESCAHLTLTVVILILILIFLINFPRKIVGEPYDSLPRRRRASNHHNHYPRVTVEIGPTPPSGQTSNGVEPNAALDTSFARSSDVSSGYLNVSYDASPTANAKNNSNPNPNLLLNGAQKIKQARKSSSPPPPPPPPTSQPPQPIQNYRRNSNKRRSAGSGSVQRRTREKSRERVQNPTTVADIPGPSTSYAQSDDRRDTSRDRSNSVSAMDNMQIIRTATSRHSQRLSRPVQDLADLLAPSDESSPRDDQKTVGDKRHVPIVRSAYVNDENRGRPEKERAASVLDYSSEPKRLGNVRNERCSNEDDEEDPETQQTYGYHPEPFRQSNPMRRSVISFDPKSNGDTLLRFHDNLARSQETILSAVAGNGKTNGPQHRPQQHAYRSAPAPDVISFDSGLPASVSQAGGSDDDPRLSRDSAYSQQQKPPKKNGHPIGYEPAFLMSYEPNDSQDEPVYRPSFLRGSHGGNGQSPVKFRYHNDDDGHNFRPAPPAYVHKGGYDPNVALKAFEESEYMQPNSLIRDEENAYHSLISGNGYRQKNGQATKDESSEDGGSENLDGLAVPRINNTSLLV